MSAAACFDAMPPRLPTNKRSFSSAPFARLLTTWSLAAHSGHGGVARPWPTNAPMGARPAFARRVSCADNC